MKISYGNGIFFMVNIFHPLLNFFNSNSFVIFKKQRFFKTAESDSDAPTIPAEEACVADFWLKSYFSTFALPRKVVHKHTSF